MFLVRSVEEERVVRGLGTTEGKEGDGTGRGCEGGEGTGEDDERGRAGIEGEGGGGEGGET